MRRINELLTIPTTIKMLQCAVCSVLDKLPPIPNRTSLKLQARTHKTPIPVTSAKDKDRSHRRPQNDANEYYYVSDIGKTIV